MTVEENWLIDDHYKRKSDALLQEYAKGFDDLSFDFNHQREFEIISAAFNRLKRQAIDFLFDYVGKKDSDEFRQLADFWFSTDTGLNDIYGGSVHSQLKAHSAFLKILHKSIMNDTTPLQGSRVTLNAAKILLAVYNKTNGDMTKLVDLDDILEDCNIDFDEGRSLRLYLEQKGLVHGSFSAVGITVKGIDRVESESTKMPETHSQKEHRVLEAIKDLSRMSRIILFPDLARRLEMSESELAVICSGLHDDDSINFPGGDFVEMKTGGYRRLEPSEKQPTTGPVINIGHNYGAAAIGAHINQVVNVTHNEEFTQAINNLVQLVQSSLLDSSDKEEATEEIVRINNLAAREPNSGRLDKIKSTIRSLEVVLGSAQLLEKARPYLDGVWNYIKTKYQLS